MRMQRLPLILLGLCLVFLVGCQAPHNVSSTSHSLGGDLLLIDFLDVGQGDAVLIRAPGGPTILVDGGRPGGQATEQLQARGVERLDMVLATHADYDHCGVHERLLGDFPVRVYLHNGLPHTTRSYARILKRLEGLVASGSTQVFAASAFAVGHDLGGDGVGLRLLPPPPSLASEGGQNQQSVGLVVTRGAFKAVLAGDAEGPQLEEWLASSEVARLVANADVYKAAHHGADNGDPAAPQWLDLIQPDLVAVPVGENSYGHPTAAALALYRRHADTVVRTDTTGGIQIRVGPGGAWSLRPHRSTP